MDEQKRRPEDEIIDVNYTAIDDVADEPIPDDDKPQEEAPLLNEASLDEAIPLEEEASHVAYYHETIKENEESLKRKQPTPKKTWGRFVAGALIVSIAGGAAIGSSFAFTAPYAQARYAEKMGLSGTTASSDGLSSTNYAQQMNYQQVLTAENPVPEISEAVVPSVVSINNNSTVTTWMGEFSQSSLGSVVVYEDAGETVYTISNAHVLDVAQTLTVTFL